MPFPLEFDAVLEAGEGDGGVLAVLPPAVTTALGSHGGGLLQVAFDGYPHAGQLVALGEAYQALLLPKPIRRAIGKTLGDTVHVVLTGEAPERALAAPADLAAELAAHPKAAAYFAHLAYPDQRDYVRWLSGAKPPERRARRLAEIVAMLAQGRKRG